MAEVVSDPTTEVASDLIAEVAADITFHLSVRLSLVSRVVTSPTTWPRHPEPTPLFRTRLVATVDGVR